MFRFVPTVKLIKPVRGPSLCEIEIQFEIDSGVIYILYNIY